MTEVTKSNYISKLPEVFEAIREADFVAIDTNAEATGFLLHNESINPRELKGTNLYDSIRKRQKTRSPLDFGIAIFKKIPDVSNNGSSPKNQFEVKCYNFPILFSYVEEHDARQEIRDARYTEERLDIDALGFEFLQRINFDINKTLYDGTPFMNKERQKEAQEYMEKHPDFMIIQGKHVTNGDLELQYFPKVIEKLEPENISEILERLRGIGKFFDVTAETKIPVVGHNLLVKLMMLYKDFVEYLPNEYSEFLGKLEKVLPQFYDTKFIANEISCREDISESKKIVTRNTGLYELFRNTDWIGQFTLQFDFEEFTKLYEEDLEDLKSEKIETDNTSFCHESGFDACIAGIVFTKLVVLTCHDFNKDVLSSQGRNWRNKMFIQNDIEKGIISAENERKSNPSCSGSGTQEITRSFKASQII